MLFYFLSLIVLQGVLAIPIENESVDISPQKDIEVIMDPVELSRTNSDVSRTLGFSKLQKLNPFYWISDDTEDITERIEKLEKRQKVLYDVLICSRVPDDKCRKLNKLAAKLFKKKGASEEDEDDKPEPKPTKTIKPTKTENKPAKTATAKPSEEATKPVEEAVTTPTEATTNKSPETTITEPSASDPTIPPATVMQPLTTIRITSTNTTTTKDGVTTSTANNVVSTGTTVPNS